MVASCVFVLTLNHSPAMAPEYRVVSPNGLVTVTVTTGRNISYAVSFGGRELVSASTISMTVTGGRVLGRRPVVVNESRRTVDEIIRPVVREKAAEIRDAFSELSLELRGEYGLDVRAYDDGVAYRFRTAMSDEQTVISEEFTINFTSDHSAYFPTEESFLTHSERLYEQPVLSEIPPEKMASMPVLVDVDGGPKVAITESDLRDYPGMYLAGTGGTALRGVFPAYPLKEEQVGDRTVRVVERADYIARTSGERTFPWRILIIAREDADLIENTMVYRLAPKLELVDTSWIRPGKVAWDWWNANNIYGVDFRAGVNTETYRYYIDFAADHGTEYVILDEGWYGLGDLFDINPEIDMEELLSFARDRGVGIILWVVWKTLDDQLQPALDQFERWGVAGIKVDFMQRDDQLMVHYYWKIAAEAAKRRLLVDFHGAYKPAGLRRAYPNVLTREGVRGLENSKWSEHPTPEHNVTLPFTRMLAGPVDYTPGAMINAQEKNFHPVFTRPMSLGTRCHQLAMYVVFESPLQMLADSPSNYLREPECLRFLSAVPTVWDETRVLAARVGDYVALARRHGDEWYIGAMTDWKPRELALDLSFLGEGAFCIEIFEDGVNADRNAIDYRRVEKTIMADESLTISLAPGGGWAARITPRVLPRAFSCTLNAVHYRGDP
ncbi:MAG: glycoside hydrolase family 97 protein [Candidatus Latescibacteria bacterium]|nr:glycoside hydrolase family 97 protein [Candidatus Latescibacterota bacterium]